MSENVGFKKNRRSYLCIYWKCCNQYSHIYKNKEQTAYTGLCPGCRRSLQVPIGPEGTKQRVFIAE